MNIGIKYTPEPQTMDIVDKPIHWVVYQKSDFDGNINLQNCQKLDLLKITTNNFSGQNTIANQRYFCARNWLMVNTKVG
jgi:hypothetical protein